VYGICLILVALWCSLILAAPFFQSLSSQTQPVAAVLYRFFARICHQLDERSFHLNGEPWAVCIRCSAIYGGFLLGLLLVPVLRGVHAKNPPARRWLLVAALPMVVDVSLNLAGIHESTSFTRGCTGLLLGGIAPFYIMPLLIESIRQRVQQLSTAKGGFRYARKTE
jgi:uncharacterized membrane protein